MMPYSRHQHLLNRVRAKSAAEQVLDAAGPFKPGTYQERDGIWIVAYRLGHRMVFHFDTLDEAHARGFSWAR